MRGGATELSGEASQSLVLAAHVDALVWADVLGAKSPGPEREASNGVDGGRAVHTGQGLGLAEDGEGTRPRQEPKPRTGRRGPEVTARAQGGSARQLVGAVRAADRAGCTRPSWGHETASEESPERGKAAISGKQSLSEARVALRVRVRRSARGVRTAGACPGARGRRAGPSCCSAVPRHVKPLSSPCGVRACQRGCGRPEGWVVLLEEEWVGRREEAGRRDGHAPCGSPCALRRREREEGTVASSCSSASLLCPGAA